jgi:hypothetical protein
VAVYRRREAFCLQQAAMALADIEYLLERNRVATIAPSIRGDTIRNPRCQQGTQALVGQPLWFPGPWI